MGYGKCFAVFNSHEVCLKTLQQIQLSELIYFYFKQNPNIDTKASSEGPG